MFAPNPRIFPMQIEIYEYIMQNNIHIFLYKNL